MAFLRQIRNPRKIKSFFSWSPNHCDTALLKFTTAFEPESNKMFVSSCFWTENNHWRLGLYCRVNGLISNFVISYCAWEQNSTCHVCHQWLLHVSYVVYSQTPSKSENTMPIILPPLICVWNILGFSKLWCCHWTECCFVSGFHWWFHVSTFVTITKMDVLRYVDEIQNFFYKI